MLANWRASREGKARITSALADAEVRRIEVESDVGALRIIAAAQAEARRSIDTTIESGRGMVEITRGDITQSIEFQGRKRLTNVRSVVEEAADELDDKEVADHEPDPDWTARFFDCVQDVSSQDMQKIWAKLLSGEVESPGRTSLRTLDTLRNMTKKDAILFKNICDFVIGGDFVFYDWKYVKQYSPLEYDNLLHIQDCGLINVGPNLVEEVAWGDKKKALVTYQDGVLMISGNPDADDELEIPAIVLTTAGKELFRIAQCTLHMRYLQSFSRFLQLKSCELSYLEGVRPLPDGTLRYARRIPIEPHPEQVEDTTP